MINTKFIFSLICFFVVVNASAVTFNQLFCGVGNQNTQAGANNKAGDNNKNNKNSRSMPYEKVSFYSTAVLAGYFSKDFFPLTAKGLLVSATVLGTGLFITSHMTLADTQKTGGKGKPINITWLTTSVKCFGWLVSALAVNGALNCAAKASLYINGDAFLKNVIMPIFVRRHTFN